MKKKVVDCRFFYFYVYVIKLCNGINVSSFQITEHSEYQGIQTESSIRR